LAESIGHEFKRNGRDERDGERRQRAEDRGQQAARV